MSAALVWWILLCSYVAGALGIAVLGAWMLLHQDDTY